ncbi:MAG TPA: Rrf2 family transcriptional regulator [Longimicrobium sp.]|nr:Rrf2 family transcriptional regulator [Longimicrobium sp.]
MKRSNRFSVALHVLVHLAERSGEPATSEQLAACVRTNPVVVRRTLAGLREAGLVASAAGHGGGWTLARDAESVTLADVYAALGERMLFAIDLSGGNPECRVQRAVSGTLDDFLHDAEALLAARLSRLTVADVAVQACSAGGGDGTGG